MIHRYGRVEVICGSMFCGKSEELIRRARRAVIAKQQLQVFKPNIDTRYSIEHVTSHNGQKIEAQAIQTAKEIIDQLLPSTTVVAIDEVQFFDAQIVSVVDGLANRGIRVILAGLDTDFRAEPFGSMPSLMSLAEEVTKLHAICVVCGNPANHTQRLVASGERVLLGASGTYEARCRQCFDPRLAQTGSDPLKLKTEN